MSWLQHRYCMNVRRVFSRLSRFIGPGFLIAVGYLDPGNWATDMEGGSQFGYQLLFIILVSNFIAMFLQNLTIRLGTVAGMDLASACRRYLPRYMNLVLYLLAEGAIIATDLAEVIGSAIALNLLFPSLPLPAGVAITAVDVFIILLFYHEPEDLAKSSKAKSKHQNESTLRMIKYFELFVMILVAAVGACFVVELVYSDIVAVDVLKGYLPSKEIFTNPDCLYVAIGIIGATVMPHNLFLHSYIIQARTYAWRDTRPLVKSTAIDDSDQGTRYNVAFAPVPSALVKRNLGDSDEKQWQHAGSGMTKNQGIHNDILSVSDESRNDGLDANALRHYLETNMKINLRYGFIDLFVALLFAFFVNSAILIVASANFHYGHLHVVSDLFDAHALLQQYLGPAAAVVFALALLCSGQSSTLTATLAGQVVMSGFLGMSGRPWIRRIVTRLIAIVPAMVAACVAGRSGLSSMLVASQVALSIQLPFAVIPLVWFTSMKRIMHLDLIHNAKQDLPPALPLWLDRALERCYTAIETSWKKGKSHIRMPNCKRLITKSDNISSSIELEPEIEVTLQELPEPVYYANGKTVIAVAVLIALLLVGLNAYLVVSTIISPQ